MHLPLVFPCHIWDILEIPLSSGSNDTGTLLVAIRDMQQPGIRERALMALRKLFVVKTREQGATLKSNPENWL